MEYGWGNDDLWTIKTTQDDFDDFEQPYIGNGLLGSRFDKLVAGTGDKPLSTLSRAVYDGGRQLLLPAWNHIMLEVAGILYRPENGKHQLEQVLDIRNGTVRMVDQWEYKQGKSLRISVEMFLPRTFGHASYLSLQIEQLDEAANVKFGVWGSGLEGDFRMSFTEEQDSILLGDYLTARQARPVSQALAWRSEGLGAVSVTTASDDQIAATAALHAGSAKLELFHCLMSYEEGGNTRADALEKAKHLRELGRDALLETSSQEWKRLWSTGVAFRNGDLHIEKSLLLHQFHLLGSLESGNYPLGPLGLSMNGWGGNQLWDADLWIFRGILPLWPDYAKSIIDFRRKTLAGAVEHARVTGYKGAWYAWETDEEGRNITPALFNDELHVNIWIALAAWEYHLVYGDGNYLRETGWPIISAIADFFSSRAELGADGLYHINCVLGPDEAVAECGQMRVNDNFLTNYGVTKVMDAACRAAEQLNVTADQSWRAVGEGMYLPVPDANGIYPEYRLYNGHGIKQADVILTFYPLGFDADPEIIQKNIIFYRDKQMYYGPLMSSQIESCIMMRQGDKEKGLARLFSGMAEFTRGKHYMPFECRDNDNSIMLTGIGGELQALIFGYYGADLDSFDKIPRLGQYIT